MTTPPPPPPPPSGGSGGPPPTPGAGGGMRPDEARLWALGAHLSAFVGAFVGLAFLGPLVVWLVRRDDDPFVAHHGREALNFNLTVLLVGIAAVVATVVIGFLTLGFGMFLLLPVGLAIGLWWVVLPIIGAVKANSGEWWRYPATIRFVR